MTQTMQAHHPTEANASLPATDVPTATKARRVIVEPTQEKLREVARSLRQNARRGQRALRRDKRRVEKRIRRHPATTVGIAFGAGILAGALVTVAITAGGPDDPEHGLESRGV